MAELLFENFNILGVYWSLSNVTGIFAEGKTSGLVIDSGFTGTYALNIFEGYPVEDNLSKSNLGGNYLNESLEKQVSEIINKKREK